MHFAFQSLWPLFLLPVCVIPVLLTRRLFAISLAVFFLVAALCAPVVLWTTVPARLVVLLDLSASSRGTVLRDPRYLSGLLAQHLPADTRISVVGFAAAPRVLLDDVAISDRDHWPTVWPELGVEQAGDVEGVLRWGAADSPMPRWLFTTTSTPMIESLPNTIVTRIDNPNPDWAIADVAANPGGGAMRVRIRAPAKARGDGGHRLVIRANDVVVSQIPVVAAAAGDFWVPVDVPAAAGLTYYKFELVPHTDLWPENDSAEIVVAPTDGPRIWQLSAGHLPQSAEELLAGQIQAVIAPAGIEVPLPTAAILRDFVLEAGGGLLIIGDQPALRDLSPLTPDNPLRPPLHVIFLLDASGSMNQAGVSGESRLRIAARAIAGAASLFHAGDRFSVYAFNGTTTLLAEGEPRAMGDELAQNLPLATGPTNVDSALPALLPMAQDSGMKTRLILLTDGELPAVDIPRWKALAAAMPMVVIAPRPVSNASVFGQFLAQTQARLLAADNPEQWERLLREAVAPAVIERTDPLYWRRVDGNATQVSGVSQRWQELYPASGAMAYATGVDDRQQAWTVAGKIRRGLGMVAATSMLQPDAGLVDSLAQQIGAAPGDLRFVLEAHPEGNGMRIVANAFDPVRRELMNGENLALRVFSGERSQSLPLVQSAPGRYEALVKIQQPFAAVLMRHGEADVPVGRITPPRISFAHPPARGTADDPAADVQQLRMPQRLSLVPFSLTASVLLILLQLWGKVKMGKV